LSTVRRGAREAHGGLTLLANGYTNASLPGRAFACYKRATMTTTAEKLGPAEKILQTLLNLTDHMIHNRPGLVTQDARHTIGVRWVPVTHKEEGGQKVVYELTRVGKKTTKIRKGVMRPDKKV